MFRCEFETGIGILVSNCECESGINTLESICELNVVTDDTGSSVNW